MPLCPECATRVHVTEQIEVGNVVLCPNCQIPLEVTCQEPMQLALAPELLEGDWAD